MTESGLIIVLIFFAAGLLGTFLPVLPGAPLIFLGTLIYGWIAGFPEGLNISFYLGQGIAVILALSIDYLAGVWGTIKYGGSTAAVWGGIIGAVLGILAMGPLGIIAGPFIGAVVADLWSCKDFRKALKAGYGTIIGFLGGTLAKLAIEITMIIWFFIVL